MTEDLRRRLRRIESIAPTERPPAGPSLGQRMFLMVLAFHKGAWMVGESLMHGWARALGYETFPDFESDGRTDISRITTRHNMAADAFLAEHDLDPVANRDEATALIERLFEAIPHKQKARLAAGI